MSRDVLDLCRRRCAERGLSPALVEADMTTPRAPIAVAAADPARSSTTTYLRYERWVAGALDATELMPFRLQHWSVGAFTALVVEAGFSTVEVTADHCGAEPGADSEIWTFSARA